MAEKPFLDVNHVDVRYGHLQVLWDVSISVGQGEIVSLIGSNGAGKTTLLSTVSGLIHPMKGTITFQGKRINDMPPYKIVESGISMVPEGRRIIPEMTVIENLKVGTYPSAARKNKAANLDRVYRLFPVLQDRKNQMGVTLSGGEQQMLAIGRALMSEPKLLLFDEVSLGLAPIVVDKLYTAINEINDGGMTIVLVEQNTQRSLIESDRAYILNGGHIVLEGNARELSEREIRSAYFGVEASKEAG